MSLLQKVVAPVGQVEHSEDGRESHSTDHIYLLSPGGEFVQPHLQEVVVLLRLHVDLAMMQFAHQRVVVPWRATGVAGDWGRRAVSS